MFNSFKTYSSSLIEEILYNVNYFCRLTTIIFAGFPKLSRFGG